MSAFEHHVLAELREIRRQSEEESARAAAREENRRAWCNLQKAGAIIAENMRGCCSPS